MDYEVLLAGDKFLYQNAKKLAEAKRPFVIRADRRFRHSERLVRMLKFSFEGGKKASGAGWWTRHLDAWFSMNAFGCWGMACDRYNYTWGYERTPEGVDLFFDPPSGEDELVGIARQLPKQRG